MAKSNQKSVRKRSNSKKKLVKKCETGRCNLSKQEKSDILPINSQEVMYFNQVIEVSNAYAKTMSQHAQYDMALKALEKNRYKINKGEYTVLNVPVAPDTTTALTGKKEMLKYLDNQIHQLRTALLGIKGQMDNKRDIYTELGLRLETFITQRFGNYRVKKVASDGSRADEEKVLFEAEYEELVKSEKKQAEFKKALTEAKKAK